MAAIWVAAYYCVRNDYVVPSLWETFISLWLCLAENTFWVAFGYTVARTAEAFVISFVLAAFFAALSANSSIFASIVKPFITVLRTVPTLAVILMLLIWTTPRLAPVIVTVLVLFPLIYARITAAFGSVGEDIKEMARLYRVRLRDRLFKIYLPLISPEILPQTGADISFGLKIIISAEVLANTYQSVGGLMQTAKLYLDMPRLAALTVVAVAVGIVVETAFSQLVRLTYRWNRKEDADGN